MLACLIVGYFFSFVSIKILKPYSHKVGLVDKPNQRKNHYGEIPLIGGIAVYCSLLITSILILPDTTQLRLFLFATGAMVLVGAIDDRFDLRVRHRLLAQVLIACLMIFGLGVYLEQLGDIFNVGVITLGVFGVGFTILCVLGAINAFNMVDGIDGLVGSLSINSFLSIMLLVLLSNSFQFAIHTFEVVIPCVISVSILAYLRFNLFTQKRIKKVFMGDAGSMFIGLSIVWLLTVCTQGDSPLFRPVAALWIIAIPLIDMLTIVKRRILRKQNPFKPDRDHLHHIFMRVGFTDRQALMIITAVSISMSTIGILGEVLKVNESIMFVGFILALICYIFFIRHVWKFTIKLRKLLSVDKLQYQDSILKNQSK
ncbi:UDP-N-acetylglucosamine--undecaprenyl-phosphate N-acetylglucosaminephosphotransferase [Thalassotalea mangrovi]|uniref:Undecaprenyl-phosphate alpha-N-acetylglucosaminyl 1-phosphate transferase n=2 Tax=Thalassotalea mangrovi TaxID=2572245 RepID=A0A4V5NWY1_9GAMM|nr:UDP-N-acetylglucosamine--undecaprenyl-phosphate N-acetylglucosaminephosphotransferase [Thalassotalea mangrovi]